jgi:APA family basic amino acid/polyamine antiporter
MLSSVLVIGAVIVLRIRKPHLVRPFRLPLFPLPAVITLLLALWLMWQTAVGNPTELKASAVVVGGLALLAAVRK